MDIFGQPIKVTPPPKLSFKLDYFLTKPLQDTHYPTLWIYDKRHIQYYFKLKKPTLHVDDEEAVVQKYTSCALAMNEAVRTALGDATTPLYHINLDAGERPEMPFIQFKDGSWEIILNGEARSSKKVSVALEGNTLFIKAADGTSIPVDNANGVVEQYKALAESKTPLKELSLEQTRISLHLATPVLADSLGKFFAEQINSWEEAGFQNVENATHVFLPIIDAWESNERYGYDSFFKVADFFRFLLEKPSPPIVVMHCTSGEGRSVLASLLFRLVCLRSASPTALDARSLDDAISWVRSDLYKNEKQTTEGLEVLEQCRWMPQMLLDCANNVVRQNVVHVTAHSFVDRAMQLK